MAARRAGFDYYLTKHWALNADVKYLVLETSANTPFGANSVHVTVNPWIVGGGLGYRFGMADIMGAPVVAKY